MTSSNDEVLCQHAFTSVGPNKWNGDIIEVKFNDEKIAEIPERFTEFQHCLQFENLNIETDRFQLQSRDGNGVCITSLYLNHTKIVVGKNNDLSSFWIDKNDKYCSNNSMSTSEITIQNERVVSSSCKPADQDDVLYADLIEARGFHTNFIFCYSSKLLLEVPHLFRIYLFLFQGFKRDFEVLKKFVYQNTLRSSLNMCGISFTE